jgi:hypothetical protein
MMRSSRGFLIHISRFLAVLAICKYTQKNNQLFSIFLDLSINDKSSDIRLIAFQELASSWHDDPKTLKIIKEQVTDDKDNSIRNAAVQALKVWWDEEVKVNIEENISSEVLK